MFGKKYKGRPTGFISVSYSNCILIIFRPVVNSNKSIKFIILLKSLGVVSQFKNSLKAPLS